MDNRILQQLYERYGKEIRLYLCSLCRNHSMAEDLLQETFLKAILSFPKKQTNLRAWLYMVARNLCFNRMKKDMRLVSLEEMTEHEEMSDPSVNILDTLIADENSRLLYRALSKLTAPKREILIMQYFGRLSQKEIAVILHLTPENVRVLSYRARKEIKSYMEVNGYELS